jgi:hypothetical protein
MRRHLVTGLTAVLVTAGFATSVPAAGAGCLYGGLSVSRCDGPVQPDGSWQRCVIWNSSSTASGYRPVDKRCDQMGPDLHPWGLAFNDPPTHIDD